MKILRALPGNEWIPPDFPVLVSESMSIVEPVFAWLIELATVPGRSHAVDTIRTYCEHLYDWFDTLEQSNIDWVAVGEKEVAAWRNRMLEQPSPHTKRPYARSTVNDRIRSVCRFYSWAHMRGLVATLPFHYVDVHVPVRRSSFLAHIHPAPKVVKANVLTVSEHERLPRALGVIELRRFFAHLEMPYRLMAEWALTTGMRRKELCGLSTFQVPETAHLDADEHPLIGIPITITKGDYPRTVYPPIRLIDRTHHYIDEIRAPLVRRLRREKAGYRPSSMLYLNSCGRPVSRARLTAAFASAFGAAGVDATGHWLRHTFALTMLKQLQVQARETPDINPLKIVQTMLGHSSIHSTAIYLRGVEMHAAELADGISWLYGALIPDESQARSD